MCPSYEGYRAEVKGVAGWNALLRALAEGPVVVPAVVLAELLSGVALADTTIRAAARRARIDALTSRVPIVDFDAAIAEDWARLFATLSRSRKLIPSNDLAVAATALHLNRSPDREPTAWE